MVPPGDVLNGQETTPQKRQPVERIRRFRVREPFLHQRAARTVARKKEIGIRIHPEPLRVAYDCVNALLLVQVGNGPIRKTGKRLDAIEGTWTPLSEYTGGTCEPTPCGRRQLHRAQ